MRRRSERGCLPILLVSALCLTGCGGAKQAGTGTPESRAQAAALVRDREVELTALRGELAATRIAAAKKEAELQELRDLVQQLRLENAESRQAFLELRERVEQRQGEVEKARDEQERQAQTTQHLTLLKDTLVTLAQEVRQLRQDLAKPVSKDRGKSSKLGRQKSPESGAPSSPADTPQRIPSASPHEAPGRGGEASVRTVSRPFPPEKPPTMTVQPGDTLWSLAKRHRTSVALLRELNHLEGEALAVGQVLVLPMSTAP